MVAIIVFLVILMAIALLISLVGMIGAFIKLHDNDYRNQQEFLEDFFPFYGVWRKYKNLNK